MTTMLAILMTTMVLGMVVVVDTRVVTNPPPSSPWSSPIPTTTLPPGCRTNDGQELYPGQQKTVVYDGGCQICFCSYAGRVSCTIADCLVPMCADSHRPHGACCASCPHGRNCRIPMTGEIIQAGQPQVKEGMLCRCPRQNYMLPGIQSEADYTATCVPLTTIPLTTPPIPVGKR